MHRRSVALCTSGPAGAPPQGVQHLAFNSGLFYLRANERTINLMKRIDDRLMKAKLWDQSVYNEELFFISHGRYKSPQVRGCSDDAHVLPAHTLPPRNRITVPGSPWPWLALERCFTRGCALQAVPRPACLRICICCNYHLLKKRSTCGNPASQCLSALPSVPKLWCLPRGAAAREGLLNRASWVAGSHACFPMLAARMEALPSTASLLLDTEPRALQVTVRALDIMVSGLQLQW